MHVLGRPANHVAPPLVPKDIVGQPVYLATVTLQCPFRDYRSTQCRGHTLDSWRSQSPVPPSRFGNNKELTVLSEIAAHHSEDVDVGAVDVVGPAAKRAQLSVAYMIRSTTSS